jgi:hypothetical protein
MASHRTDSAHCWRFVDAAIAVILQWLARRDKRHRHEWGELEAA